MATFMNNFQTTLSQCVTKSTHNRAGNIKKLEKPKAQMMIILQ